MSDEIRTDINLRLIEAIKQRDAIIAERDRLRKELADALERLEAISIFAGR